MTDRAQFTTPIRVPFSAMAVLIGILIAAETTAAIGAVVGAVVLGAVWWRPLTAVVGDD